MRLKKYSRHIEPDELKPRIEELWAERENLNSKNGAGSKAKSRDALKLVGSAIQLLDEGEVRVAEMSPDGKVQVNEWLKNAILLLFKLTKMKTYNSYPFEYADKLPLKDDFKKAGVRVVPGASARYGSYLAPGVILMPSYVNIGAYVGENTLVDTWATVGSCAQIGKNVHLSGGVGIGGVLEPPNVAPVFVGDECLIGSRCVVAESAIVGEGSVLGAGCVLTSSIPVYDLETPEKELARGEVPPWSVAISGSRPFRQENQDTKAQFYAPCVIVIKKIPEGERHDKAALNEILRDHGSST